MANEKNELAAQLASQTEYSNQLLVQLESLELQNLAMAKDQQHKQLSFKQAMVSCERLRAEKSELEQKLSIAEQVSKRATDDSKKWKLKSDKKTEELEAFSISLERQRFENQSLGEELQKQCNEVEIRKENEIELKSQLKSRKIEEQELLEKHQRTVNSITLELEQLKAVYFPLQSEHRMLNTRCEDLLKIIQNNEQDLIAAEEDLKKARARIDALEARNKEVDQLQEHLRLQLSNAKDQGERTSSQLDALETLAASRQNELTEARRLSMETDQSNQKLKDEVNGLRADLEFIRKDFLARTELHMNEKATLENTIRDLQQDLSMLATETRENERVSLEKSRAKAQEYASARASLDERLARSLSDYTELEEVLNRTRNSMENLTQRFELEKAELEEKLLSTQKSQLEAEEALEKTKSEAKQEIANAQTDIKNLENELLSRSASDAEMLDKLYGFVRDLITELFTLQERFKTTDCDVQNMRSKIESPNDNDIRVLKDWHDETNRTLLELAEANFSLRKDFQTSLEARLAAEVQRDEEKSRIHTLEQDCRRLDTDVEYYKGRLALHEQAAKERLSEAQEELDTLNDAKSDLSEQFAVLQKQLQELKSQNRLLSDENQRILLSRADTANSLGTLLADNQKEKENAESQLQRISYERASFDADRQLFRSSIEDSAAAINRLQEYNSSLQSSQREIEARGKQLSLAHESELAQYRETQSKLQDQLNKTKGLLKVVQDQRRHLQNDNLALRSELDEALSRSLYEYPPPPRKSFSMTPKHLEITYKPSANSTPNEEIGEKQSFDDVFNSEIEIGSNHPDASREIYADGKYQKPVISAIERDELQEEAKG